LIPSTTNSNAQTSNYDESIVRKLSNGEASVGYGFNDNDNQSDF
jgi:hypothetical protein